MLYATITSGKTWTITNINFSFSPAILTISQGDTVNINIASIHDAVEVSQDTWNANGITPLSGGFSLPNGGGQLIGLTVGTHYYVCQHHVATFQMKGQINVDPVSGVNSISNIDPLNFRVFPVPGHGNIFTIYTLKERSDVEINIIDISGKTLKTLAISKQLPGNYRINLGVNNLSGIYFVRFTDMNNSYLKKILLM